MTLIAGVLKSFVGGNWGLTLALLLFVALVAWRSQPQWRELWDDPNRAWRGVARLALILQLVVLAWVGAFDYWRQLLSLPMTDATSGYSDPYTAPPVLARHIVAEPVRAVSLALLLLGLLGLALLIARSGAGPFPPLVVGVLGLLLYVVLSDARWRLELWAANGFPQVGLGTTADLLIDATFFAFLVLFVATFILLVYTTLAAWLALPIILVSGFLAARLARPTPEYRAFTDALSARAAAARTRRQREADEEQGP